LPLCVDLLVGTELGELIETENLIEQQGEVSAQLC
jgi:hypothetical protein